MPISHRNIKRFGLTGVIGDDSAIPRLKDEFIRTLGFVMEGAGYIPRYDIDPDFTLSYNGESFDFELSVYAVYVGKAKAKCLAGVDKNNEIYRFTAKNKSDVRSLQQASLSRVK